VQGGGNTGKGKDNPGGGKKGKSQKGGGTNTNKKLPNRRKGDWDLGGGGKVGSS